MTIKKGDVVEVSSKHGNHIGYIINGGSAVSIVFYDFESKKYKIIKGYGNISSLKLLEYSAMSPELKTRYDQDFTMLKKGQYVKFLNEEGNEEKGYVVKGGNIVKVLFDGSKFQTTGPASFFTVIDSIVEPEPASEMDKWSLVGFKEHRSMSELTMCFESFIACDGKKVLHIKNSDQGESNQITSINQDEQGQEMLAKFESDLKSWAVQHGSQFYIEVEVLWIDWIMFHQKLGETAKEYLEQVQREEDVENFRWELVPSK